MNIHIICLEGCHGAGKSTLCSKLRSEHGLTLLNQEYIKTNANNVNKVRDLHPQSLINENIFIAEWFQKIILKYSFYVNFYAKHPKTPVKSHILISDRSPYSCIFYTKNHKGHNLREFIDIQLEELRELGIHIHFIHINVNNKFTLWNRIEKRIKDNAERLKYGEDNKDWMIKACNFYDNADFIDTIVDNSGDIGDALASIKKYIDSLR